MIKSFKGSITDETAQTIRLSTNNGMMGYKLTKFQLINRGPPGNLNVEAVVKMYRTPQTTVDGTINFDDPNLLGVAYYAEGTSPGVGQQTTVIFDNHIFNQDIYITYKDTDTSENFCNYYIELEQIKLNIDEAAVATLKDMRGTN